MKVRVLVCADRLGKWQAFGKSIWGAEETVMIAQSWSELDSDMVWLTADIPDPAPIPTVAARVEGEE